MLVISIITMIIILNIVIIIFSINNKNNSDSLNRENCPGHLLERKLRGSLTYLHASSQLNIVFEAVTQNRIYRIPWHHAGTPSGPMDSVHFLSRT